MRTIVQQLLRGKPVEMSEEAKKEAEKEKAGSGCFTNCGKAGIILFVPAPVAQLDRALDSDSKGHAFESHRAYQNVLMKDATPKTPHESVVFSHIMRYF